VATAAVGWAAAARAAAVMAAAGCKGMANRWQLAGSMPAGSASEQLTKARWPPPTPYPPPLAQGATWLHCPTTEAMHALGLPMPTWGEAGMGREAAGTVAEGREAAARAAAAGWAVVRAVAVAARAAAAGWAVVAARAAGWAVVRAVAVAARAAATGWAPSAGCMRPPSQAGSCRRPHFRRR
jgi:hypothetical protein